MDEKREKAMLQSAIGFCKQDRIIFGLRSNLKHCEFAEDGDHSVGDFGTPPCRHSNLPTDEYCEPCKAALANLTPYKSALKSRQNAKRRMMTAFKHLRGDA